MRQTDSTHDESGVTIPRPYAFAPAQVPATRPWPILEPVERGVALRASGGGTSGANRVVTGTFLLRDSLPPAIAERWEERIPTLSREEWRARPYRERAALYTINAQVAGPIVRISLHHDVRLQREEHQVPVEHFDVTFYFLIRLDDGWTRINAYSILS